MEAGGCEFGDAEGYAAAWPVAHAWPCSAEEFKYLSVHGGCNACNREVLAVDAPVAGSSSCAVRYGGKHGHTMVRHSGQSVWGNVPVCGFQTVR